MPFVTNLVNVASETDSTVIAVANKVGRTVPSAFAFSNVNSSPAIT